MPRPVYLDYQATTPVLPEVRDAMLPYLGDRFGNPHSPHRFGFEAEAGVDAARGAVAALIGAEPDALVFTSGATEASNLALIGTLTAPGQRRRRLVTVATEHSCVLDTARAVERLGAPVTILGVKPDGLVDLDELAGALDDDVAIVSAMLVNNEIGVVQPVAEIAARAHRVGAAMHSDAAQGAGKLPVDVDALGVDLLSLSAHKMYGPKGVGALYVRPGTALTPTTHGGGQEGRGLRSGTLSPALCAGFGKAAELAMEALPAQAAHVGTLWDRMLGGLDVEHAINGSTAARWRGNLNVSFPGTDGGRLMAAVLREVALSSGAACASASGKPSHVLAALDLPDALARATLRIGWGLPTTPEEIDRAAGVITTAAKAARRRAA
jgi:cysteine desulfurase